MSKLTINKTKEGEKLTAEIIGRVDAMTAPQFDSGITDELDGIAGLVLNIRQLEYMSSAGMRVLVGLQKTMSAKKGSLTVCYPSAAILDIFTATGLTDYLKIVD